LRIISGDNRGRRIIAPKNLPVRPTTDKSKEALFNILQNSYEIQNLKILDLFSGTGNISYEFASRGAIEIYSIDKNIKCTNFIKQTSINLGMNIKVIKSDAFNFIKNTKHKFDIIFLDPPYDFVVNEYLKIINEIFSKNLLNIEGSLIIEHSEKINISEHPNFEKSRNYGGCSFSFFYI